MGVVAAERIKLVSTRSPWWCTAVVIALGLGFAALMAFVSRIAPENSEGAPELTLDVAVSGVSGFGVLVLMIMATLSVTSEYRFGVIRTTFQALPDRTSVLCAKAGLLGVFAALLTTVLAFGAYAVAKAAGGEQAESLVLAGNWRSIYAIPIVAFLSVVLAVGVGALVRQSAAAISLIVLWQLVIEPLIGVLGDVGREISPFLPFANSARFLNGGPAATGGDWHWGVWGSALYFAVFAALVFGAAVVVTNRRDT